MIYDTSKPPILQQDQFVTAEIPSIGKINCIVVGVITKPTDPHPMYILKCMDHTYPNDDYPYTTFAYPLGQITTQLS